MPGVTPAPGREQRVRGGLHRAGPPSANPAPGREQLELRRGAGDAFAAAFEMVATPALFGLAGWWLDTRLGTFPLVTLIAVLVVFGYGVWRFARQYSARVDEALEARRAGYAAAPGALAVGEFASSSGPAVGGHAAVVESARE